MRRSRTRRPKGSSMPARQLGSVVRRGSEPGPEAVEIQTFSLDELELAAAELPTFRAIPVFAALTGLRPCEWMALERADIDHHGHRHHSPHRRRGRRQALRQDGALAASRSSARESGAGARRAPRSARYPSFFLDVGVLWRSHRGVTASNPALRAAGLEHRTVYALRHTYASLSIAAGVSLFELSRLLEPRQRCSTRPTGTWSRTRLIARSALDVRSGTFRGLSIGGRKLNPRNLQAIQSGRRDSNSGPLDPQSSALTRLRHAPWRETPYRSGPRNPAERPNRRQAEA